MSTGHQAAIAREHTDDALVIARQARALAQNHRYDEAVETGGRALAMARQQYGPAHEYVAFILDDLATWHYHQQRTGDALRLATEAVEIIRKALPAASPDRASLINNFASILASQGRFQEALALHREAHKVFLESFGPAHLRSAQAARNLGAAYLELSRFAEAQQHFTEALSAIRALYGEDAIETARASVDLAGALLRQEQRAEAAKLLAKARGIVAAKKPLDATELAAIDVRLAQIDIQESRLNSASEKLENALTRLDASKSNDPLAKASVLYNLGWIHILRRKPIEAERIYKDVLALYRRIVGERHPAIARVLHSLAIVYQDLGLFDEAERFFQQALDVFSTSFGEIDASVAATRLEYSMLLTERDRPDAAMKEARTALSIFDQVPGAWDLKRGYANAVLALALHKAGDPEAATKTYRRAIDLISRVRGDESSDLPPALTDLGRIYRAQHRFEDANSMLERAIAIREKDGAITPAGLAESLSELAHLRVAEDKLSEALTISRRAVHMTQGRLDLAHQSFSAAALGEQRQARHLFEQFLDVAHLTGQKADGLLREMFEVAQLPHLTSTAAAVSRMASRFSTGETRLAQLVREREDAVEHWRALDRSLVEALTRTQTAELVASGRDARPALAELTQRIEAFDKRIRAEFPRYAELTAPRPVSVDSVQAVLGADEALLLQVTSTVGTFLFLVTRTGLKLARTGLTQQQLQAAVDSLRNGLDIQKHQLADLPPFDTDSAFLLYRSLIQPFQDELRKVKHIVAVPDRAMQNLPLSVLLVAPSEKPTQPSDFSRLDFLVSHFALSVAPSVGSFVALRSVFKRADAPRALIGFGDPDLTGSGTPASTALVEGIVKEHDPPALRAALVPLPETREELETLARSLNAPKDALYFRERAAERVVKSTDLAQYRIVAFATHGLLAGEFRGIAEPALVLSPPLEATPLDDGLLSASEIATLNLNADWVLLAACNTAAPAQRYGAEGLSGLAKAFIYAGSRALLVSHWWVASQATVLLTTGAIGALVKDPAIGRAEALRRAMLPLVNGQAGEMFSHPVFWAPFINVGEGGAGR